MQDQDGDGIVVLLIALGLPRKVWYANLFRLLADFVCALPGH